MKNNDFENVTTSQQESMDSAPENAQEKSKNDLEQVEEKKGAEFYRGKVDHAQEILLAAQENAHRIEGQNTKLAQLREKLGISSGENADQSQDRESVQKQLEGAKSNFRSAFGEWGRSLAQEKFSKDGETLSHEDILKSLYTEAIVDTDQVDENGNVITRTIAQEYEARLKSLQESTYEQLPAYKKIAAQLFEKYNRIPKWKKIAVGTLVAAGIGAASGGAVAAVTIAANKLVKMKLSGLIAGGADVLLQKHMQKRDEKNQMQDSDFAQKMNEVAEESFESAMNNGGDIEQGILEGVEKKMRVLDEMIAHQKSKQKIRMVTAVAAGTLMGSGFFDVDDAMAGSGIKSGSFDFGGSSVHEQISPGHSGGVVTEKISTMNVDNVDNWDIPKSKTMAAGLERSAGVIPDANGKTMEVDIRPNVLRSVDQVDPQADPKVSKSDNWDIPKNKTMEADIRPNVSHVEAQSEVVPSRVSEVVAHSGDNVSEMLPGADIFDQLTTGEVQSLRNADAGVIMTKINDPVFANTESAQVLRRIRTDLGIARIGQDMHEYLKQYDKPLTFAQKKAIISFINKNAIG